MQLVMMMGSSIVAREMSVTVVGHIVIRLNWPRNHACLASPLLLAAAAGDGW